MFLAPYMLWGALAAGIPIALHFFFRSRYRTVPWAAMKFLLTSVEQTSRRLKFQELLLLLMRCAVLVLLALALARPITALVRGSGHGDAVDAVFLIDTSYSMGAKDGPQTRFERAQEEAKKIIDTLPPHSTVQVVTCAGGGATLIGPRSPGNLDQARGLIKDLPLTDLATDLYPGVHEAAEVLRRGQSSNKELYVFSDMQKSGWERQSGNASQILQEVQEKALVHLVRCGTRPVKNAAIVGISPQSGVPRPGARVNFAVLVRNTGTDPLNDLKVSLTVDGDDKTVETQLIPVLEPGETRSVALGGKLEKAGLRTLTARLSHDDMDGDNRFDQVIEVRDQIHILVVDGHYDERYPEKSSSYKLTHALIPATEAERATFYLQPRYVTPRLASPALLGHNDLCILVNVALAPKAGAEGLPEDFVQALDHFVRQGKGLVVFAGDNVVPEVYNKVLGGKRGLLPLPLHGITQTPADKPLALNRSTFRLPAFDEFREDRPYTDYAGIGVWKTLDMDEPRKKDAPNATQEPAEQSASKEASPVSVALRYDNGKPAVAIRKVDGGEVVFIATAADFQIDPKTLTPSWTDWSLSKVYVPFVHATVRHLLREQAQACNVVGGEPLHWYPTEKEILSYALVQPDGKTTTRLGLPEKVGNRTVVTAPDLPRAGIYRLVTSQPRSAETAEPLDSLLSRKDGGTPIAVVPDLHESEDLQTLADGQLDERLGFTPVHMTAGETAAAISTDRFNREWTPWLLSGVLLLLVCESVLAWWCGKAW